MDARHTPGPFRFLRESISPKLNGTTGLIVDSKNTLLAFVPLWEDDAPEEAKKNIALFSAAPDLLEALKRIREIGGFSGLDHLDSVAALIAKAEGRTE